MAVHKAIRSKSPAQPQRHGTDHQLKAEICDVLRHLNRGFGVALAALDKLEHKDRFPGPPVFPGDVINDYRYRTESLRAEANRDLLRLISGHEDREIERWGRLRAQQIKRRQ
jgi:hypothetical protein